MLQVPQFKRTSQTKSDECLDTVAWEVAIKLPLIADLMAHAGNSCTWESEAGGFPGLIP